MSEGSPPTPSSTTAGNLWCPLQGGQRWWLLVLDPPKAKFTWLNMSQRARKKAHPTPKGSFKCSWGMQPKFLQNFEDTVSSHFAASGIPRAKKVGKYHMSMLHLPHAYIPMVTGKYVKKLNLMKRQHVTHESQAFFSVCYCSQPSVNLELLEIMTRSMWSVSCHERSR